MLRHVALPKPTQGIIFYYALKVSCIFLMPFFFSSGRELIRVEKDLYDSYMYDSWTSEIFTLCYATTMHTLYLELYST